ncbi:TRAP transporter small permease subunit [Psychromarinibacter halotolerans]|uniref:TRAP transporter small permease protein n=1 Tax=Psychromarinibacter halotolerans TaxID=1775175 RepID=A0ABV7GXD7_9RHOB|nr:TRAP transporter small permease [Psychromarinibacter halotolerans]MDF0597656.1 TRAP transporter small permease [Psychromarinibacter halotolerans]
MSDKARPLGRLLRLAELAGRAMTLAAAVALALATLHIFADAIATKFFRSPLFATHQIVTSYYMVALFFLPLAHAELRGAHITADLLYSALPRGLRTVARKANGLFLTAFLGVMTWQAWVKAISQTARGEKDTILGTPFLIWPSRWLVVVGLGAMTLAALLTLLTRGDDDAVSLEIESPK